jgi:transglutaminase-like putative cysteine protease
MTEFLQRTAVIDWDEPEVMARAAELAGRATDEEEIARRCFDWVRDEVRHSSDHGIGVVTCAASEVLRERAGFCYAKSHLLAALLRARGIPAALCYQRLGLDEGGRNFCLHGMVAVYLGRHGWYRVDPRGNKAGIITEFCPPVERLAFGVTRRGELDVPGLFADALPSVVATLRHWKTAEEVALNLPDYDDRAEGRGALSKAVR